MDDIIKKLYGIRDYIVRGSQPLNPSWYNEVMDDIDSIFYWLESIVEIETRRKKDACESQMKTLI